MAHRRPQKNYLGKARDPMVVSRLDYMGRHINHMARRQGVPTNPAFPSNPLSGATPSVPKSLAEAELSKQAAEFDDDIADMPDPPRHQQIVEYLYDKIDHASWTVPRAWHAYDKKLGGVDSAWALNLDGFEDNDCLQCQSLKPQLAAVIQCLAGLGGSVFNWSAGLDAVRRGDLADLILEYVRPCEKIHTTLELLCFELSNMYIGEDERPSRGVQTEWHWTTQPESAYEEYLVPVSIAYEESPDFGAAPAPVQYMPAERRLMTGDMISGGVIYDLDDPNMEKEPFLVDNSKLQAQARGLGYRRSPDLADKNGDRFAPWGEVVHGSRIGYDWLLVDENWLPMIVNGIQVIVPLDDEVLWEMLGESPMKGDIFQINKLPEEDIVDSREAMVMERPAISDRRAEFLGVGRHAPLRGAKRVSSSARSRTLQETKSGVERTLQETKSGVEDALKRDGWIE